MKLNLALALCSLSASPAFAATLWQGQGQLSDIRGKIIGNYSVSVSIEQLSAASERVKVEVVAANGAIVHKDTCLTFKSEKGWKKECDGGTSSGTMYAPQFGLGMDYYVAKDGLAYATNIILDGENEMRLLRTELNNGQATRVFAEKLTRVSTQATQE